MCSEMANTHENDHVNVSSKSFFLTHLENLENRGIMCSSRKNTALSQLSGSSASQTEAGSAMGPDRRPGRGGEEERPRRHESLGLETRAAREGPCPGVGGDSPPRGASFSLWEALVHRLGTDLGLHHLPAQGDWCFPPGTRLSITDVPKPCGIGPRGPGLPTPLHAERFSSGTTGQQARVAGSAAVPVPSSVVLFSGAGRAAWLGTQSSSIPTLHSWVCRRLLCGTLTPKLSGLKPL